MQSVHQFVQSELLILCLVNAECRMADKIKVGAAHSLIHCAPMDIEAFVLKFFMTTYINLRINLKRCSVHVSICLFSLLLAVVPQGSSAPPPGPPPLTQGLAALLLARAPPDH